MPIIFAFERAHQTNTICSVDCTICAIGGDDHYITNAFKERIPLQPLYIIRRATREEWVQSVVEDGGNAADCTSNDYYYEVSTD